MVGDGSTPLDSLGHKGILAWGCGNATLATHDRQRNLCHGKRILPGTCPRLHGRHPLGTLGDASERYAWKRLNLQGTTHIVNKTEDMHRLMTKLDHLKENNCINDVAGEMTKLDHLEKNNCNGDVAGEMTKLDHLQENNCNDDATGEMSKLDHLWCNESKNETARSEIPFKLLFVNYHLLPLAGIGISPNANIIC